MAEKQESTYSLLVKEETIDKANKSIDDNIKGLEKLVGRNIQNVVEKYILISYDDGTEDAIGVKGPVRVGEDYAQGEERIRKKMPYELNPEKDKKFYCAVICCTLSSKEATEIRKETAARAPSAGGFTGSSCGKYPC